VDTLRRNYAVELEALFRKEKVLDLAEIGGCFPERSRTSLVRDLQKVSAITSYNHCGKHYTLPDIAEFNDQGIWQHKGAMFSAHGNLKHTIKSMVDCSRNGMTHNELKAVLNLRVHDILLAMVRDNQIAREEIHEAYVYVSANSDIGQAQKEARIYTPRRSMADSSDPMIIIEVLSYALGHPQATAADAYIHVKDRGVSRGEVEAIYDQHVQGKKN
jgi:hypothetical protein